MRIIRCYAQLKTTFLLMDKRQFTFIVIALLYLANKIISIFILDESHSVIPGWHVTLDVSGSFERYLAFLYFFTVSILYGTLPNYNKTLYVLHAIVSLLPLIVVIGFQFFSTSHTAVIMYYDNQGWIDFVFMTLQTAFLVCLYFNHRNWRMRITSATQKQGDKI